MRIDYSLRRLIHYTGTDWRTIQPWILCTNYQRYVDHFLVWALEELARPDGPYSALVLPGGAIVQRGDAPEAAEAAIATAPWHRFQMPAYSLLRSDGRGGITLINIGVGPSNAKNATDHLAVLRPHCWLMIGHCGGLRQSQTIGDYVLAHGYMRRDRILDDLVPPEVPVPALAEVQVALQTAAERVTGERGDALKRRLRTGTVVSYDDRNWELRWSQERRRINHGRAIAVDMESATLATQGYRLRVPYGTLLCVSDKPLHGEIKLPGLRRASTSAQWASISISAWKPWSCCEARSARCTRASCAASTNRRSGKRAGARPPAKPATARPRRARRSNRHAWVAPALWRCCRVRRRCSPSRVPARDCKAPSSSKGRRPATMTFGSTRLTTLARARASRSQ